MRCASASGALGLRRGTTRWRNGRAGGGDAEEERPRRRGRRGGGAAAPGLAHPARRLRVEGRRGSAAPRRGGPRTSSAAAPHVRANGSQPHGGHGSACDHRRRRRGLSEGGDLPGWRRKGPATAPSGSARAAADAGPPWGADESADAGAGRGRVGGRGRGRGLEPSSGPPTREGRRGGGVRAPAGRRSQCFGAAGAGDGGVGAGAGAAAPSGPAPGPGPPPVGGAAAGSVEGEAWRATFM